MLPLLNILTQCNIYIYKGEQNTEVLQEVRLVNLQTIQ